MRRFVTVLALLLFTIPFGISLTGCSKKAAPVYCNGGDTGLTVGQLQTITLQPQLFGVSLNQAQMGQVTAPTATDCKGNAVSVTSYTYATSNMNIADINPTTGALCGGNWNRNTPGGIANYTTCAAVTLPANTAPIAYITASANGVSSNAIPVYVHPIVTGVVLGAPSTNCATDPATNCSPASVNTTLAATAVTGCPAGDPMLANGCCTTPPNTFYGIAATPAYNGGSCISQTKTGQLSARAYAGTGATQTNISCEVGQIAYTAQTPSVVTIDENGIATAQQPGSSIISTTLAQAGSSAGYFSTCPPVNIALSYPNTSPDTTNITVDPNYTQPVTAVATDMNGQVLTGLTLEYTSTAPIPIPAASAGTITPVYPGEAAITAVCQPPACNPAPYSEIGIYGNGVPVSSHSLTVTTPGTNSTDLYIASTQSRYLVPVDFTQTTLGAPILLPYAPNSMAISNDGTTIYLGSSTELMVLATSTGTITNQNTSDSGYVLGVSPNNSTIVIADPVRKQIYLYTATSTTTTGTGSTATTTTTGGTVASTYGFIPTYDTNSNLQAHASWSPDSQTVYIALGDQILVYSFQTGWNSIPLTPAPTSTPAAGATAVDVAATVPAVGAYFAGPTTSARGYCPVTTSIPPASTLPSTPQNPTSTNVFYPPADPTTCAAAANTDRLAATSDGAHMLGASAATGLLSDIAVNLAPTLVSSTNPNGTQAPPNATTETPGAIVCPANGTALTFTNAVTTSKLGITAQTITGVLPTSVAAATTSSAPVTAFVTYIGSGGVLPAYVPGAIQGGTGTANSSTPEVPTITAGTLTDIPLATATNSTAAPSAPVAGVISTDNSTLFVGTSGDAMVHLISITGMPNIVGLSSAPTPLTDFQQIAPNLPCSPITAATMPGYLIPADTPPCVTSTTGQSIAVPNLLVQKPRPST
jgi:trimeric autotransporter adhesin